MKDELSLFSGSSNPLPDEILVDIFRRLKPSDLFRAGAVCRSWQRVADEPSLWRCIDFRDDRLEPSAMWRIAEQHFGEHVKAIHFKLELQNGNLIWSSPSMTFLRSMCDKCPSMEELTFEQISINNVGIRHILAPHLKKLSLVNTAITSAWSSVLSVPEVTKRFCKLTHLDLSGSRNIKDDDLVSIASAKPSLISLKLNNVPEIFGNRGMEAIVRNLTALQHLELSHSDYHGSWHQVFRHLTNLVYLDVCSCGLFEFEFETIATHVTRLQTLIISDCRYLKSSCTRAAHKMKSLRLLDVTRTKLASKKAVGDLQKSLPDCKILTASPRRSMTRWKEVAI